MHRYHRIRLVLQQRILDGVYSPNALLPGERALAQEFGVSRVTMQTALGELEREGLVRRERGRGTIVAPQPETIDAKGKELDAFDVLLNSVLGMGLRTKAVVLAFETATLPQSVAHLFGEPSGSMGRHIVRVRLYKERPISHSVVWMPMKLSESLTAEALEERPLLQILKEQGHNVVRTEEVLSASAADPAVAQALGIPIGHPLLSVRRIAFDDRARPLLVFDASFHSHHYKYRLLLSKSPEPARVTVMIS